jgi:hypothetical protein
MIHDKETLETAERFADSGDNESGSFLGHQLKAIRKKSYLAGVAYAREKQGAYPGKVENLDNVNKKERGLFEKYHVERVDGKPMPAGCIVLEWKDTNAWPGIAAFSRAVRSAGYLQLSDDLDKHLEAMGYCAREKQEPTPKDKNALSHRIRPNCEAAPWVIEAVKKIENDNSKLKAKLERAKDALRFYADPFNWQSRSGKIGAHGVWNDGGECDHPLRVCGGHKAREALKELEE